MRRYSNSSRSVTSGTTSGWTASLSAAACVGSEISEQSPTSAGIQRVHQPPFPALLGVPIVNLSSSSAGSCNAHRIRTGLKASSDQQQASCAVYRDRHIHPRIFLFPGQEVKATPEAAATPDATNKTVAVPRR